MTASEAYVDLGGGLRSTPQRRSTARLPRQTAANYEPHECRFDAVSGWCGCGRRDDGQIAEGSPAWSVPLAAA